MPTTDFAEYLQDLDIEAQQNRDRQRAARVDPLIPEDPEPVNLLEDIGVGILGGFEGAGRGLAEIVTDLESEPVFAGRTQTIVGGFTEGVVNFLTGFIPAAGVLGKFGKLSKAVQASRATVGGRAAVQIGRATAAGAIADATVIDNQQAGLSRLLEEHTDFADPILEFLAGPEDQGELEGRLRGTLEGALLGPVVDGLVMGLRGLRSAARARSLNQDPVKAFTEAIDRDTMVEGVRAADQAARGDEARILDELDNRSPFVRTIGTEGDTWVGRVGQREFNLHLVDTPEGPRYAEVGSTEPLGETIAEATQVLASREGLTPTSRAGIAMQDRDEVQQVIADFKKLDPEDAAVNPRNLSPAELAGRALERKDLNLRLVDEPGTKDSILRKVEGVIRSMVPERELTPNAETLARAQSDVADVLSMSPEQYAARVETRADTLDKAMVQMVSEKAALSKLSQELGDLADQARRTQTPEVLAEAVQTAQRVAMFYRGVRGLGAQSGKLLQAGNIPFMSPREVDRLVNEAGGRGKVVDFIDKLAKATEPAARLRVAEGGMASRWNMLTEFWMNSILSAPRTWVVNGIGNAMLSIYRPMELMVGAIVTGKTKVVQDAALEIQGMVASTRDALRGASVARAKGAPQLLPSSKLVDETGRRQAAITAANAGFTDESVKGQITNWVGRAVRIPGNALQTTDEFFKQLTFRGVAWRKFVREGLDAGLPPDAASARAWERMDKVIFEHQAFNRDTMMQRGRSAARTALGDNADAADVESYAAKWADQHFDANESALLLEASDEARFAAEDTTFTSALRKDDGVSKAEVITARLQDIVVQHPGLRLFAPFIQTPFNIAKWGAQRTLGPGLALGEYVVNRSFRRPMANLERSRNRLVQDLMYEGANRDRVRAEAAGRIATGVGLGSLFSSMALNDQLTGRGPRDPEQRELLRKAGWLPYSIRVGDSYIQYLRLDPFATVLGTIADMATLSRWSPEEDQDSLDEVSMGVVVALAQNFTNKTYLTGLSTLVEALTEPEVNVPKMMRRFASSFVPTGPAGFVSAALGGEITDPHFREVRTMLDAATAKIPYFGETLDPRRNFLGETVDKLEMFGPDMFSPIAYSRVSDELVNAEVAALQHSFRPPRVKAGQIDFRDYVNEKGQSSYDRKLELRSEIEIGGWTLRRNLRELMRSERYQSLPPESTPEVPSPRIALINRVVSRYDRVADLRMRKEFPDLNAAIQLQRINRRRARAGIQVP